MPADRLLHPRQGHSEKVSKLKDFEFRVWLQYILSADDFGVLRFEPHKVKADNDAIGCRSDKAVIKALEKIEKLGILISFEYQGRRFLYQNDWQDWQKIAWPTKTINPAPTAELLESCSERTRLLFAVHPGGTGSRVPRHLDDAPPPDDISRASEREIEGHLARALPAWLGIGIKTRTQVRLGNSYADIVATTPDGLVIVLEVKRHHITKATIAQVLRYAAALRAEGSTVEPVAVGYSHWDKAIDATGVSLITYDDALVFSVTAPTDGLRHLPTSFSLNDKPGLHSGKRLTANGSGLMALGSSEESARETRLSKPIGDRDVWFQQLWGAYPANRRMRGKPVMDLFNDVFTNDARPDESVWSDMWLSLQSQIAGYEWRIKGMVPAMDKWLTKERCFQRHEAAPVSALVSEKTARNLTAMEQFLKAGER